MQTFLVKLSKTRAVSSLQLCSRSGSVSVALVVLCLLLRLLCVWCPRKGTEHSCVLGEGFMLCCSDKLCGAIQAQEHRRKCEGSPQTALQFCCLANPNASFTLKGWNSSSKVLESFLVIPQPPQSALESAGGGPESCRVLQISSVSLGNGTITRNEGVRTFLTDLTLHLSAGS